MIFQPHCFLKLSFLLLLAGVCLPSNAQTVSFPRIGAPEPIYRNIDTRQGLPSSETYDILQDNAGYIWIATDRGVARYDGYRMRVFTQKDGLPDNVVFKFYQDYKGRVWFLTYNGLLSYYEGGKIVPYKYNSIIHRYSKDVTAVYKSIVIDRNDNLYYAIHYSGMIRISAKGKMTVLHDASAPGVHLQKCDGRWLASCYAVRSVNLQPGDHLRFNHIRIRDDDGKWRWVIRGHRLNGWYHVSDDGKQAFLLADSVVFDLNRQRVICFANKAIGIDCVGDELFVGLYKGGVRCENFTLPQGHPGRVRYLLSRYSVSGVMRDREGGYWFTTLEKGVFYTPGTAVDVYDHRQGLYDLEGCAIAGLRDRVFISHGKNVTLLGAATKRYAFPTIFSLANYAAATSHKVLVPRNTLETNKLYLDRQVILCDDLIFTPAFRDAYGKHDYALLCASKIWKLHEDGRYVELFNFYDKKTGAGHRLLSFEAIVETDHHKILLGCPSGLFELHNGSIFPVDGNKLFRERTSDLVWHPELGTIVGTRGRGMYVLDSNYRVGQVIDAQNGLPGDLVTCVYVSAAGDVYVGTSKGLAVFAVRKGRLVRKFLLTTAQGLSTNEIRSVYVYGRTAWVATKTGLAVVDLDNLPRRGSQKLHLESLVCGKSVYEDRHPPAVFPVDIGSIRIKWRTENFRGTRYHRFRYRLRDEAEWQTTGEPELLLNEPRWGDYRLLVQFLDDSGEWTVPQELLRFTVESPYYTRWYFVFGVILLGIGTVYLLFRARIAQINRRNQLRETIGRLEQKALRAQMNPHFIFNSLNSIQSFLMYDENEKAEKYLLRFARLIRQTLNNSRESYIPIESEMETLRGYLELEQMRFKEKFTFEISCDLSPDELQWGVPPMLIQPFVENAVLHGFKTMESGGRIEVRFEALTNNRLLCVVDDNGIGRKATMGAQPDGHKSFGTKITEERLAAFRQKYGDEFSIEPIDKTDNGNAAGTRVVLQIPVVPPGEFSQETE